MFGTLGTGLPSEERLVLRTEHPYCSMLLFGLCFFIKKKRLPTQNHHG
jgi:hypothetical protein